MERNQIRGCMWVMLETVKNFSFDNLLKWGKVIESELFFLKKKSVHYCFTRFYFHTCSLAHADQTQGKKWDISLLAQLMFRLAFYKQSFTDELMQTDKLLIDQTVAVTVIPYHLSSMDPSREIKFQWLTAALKSLFHVYLSVWRHTELTEK